MKEVARLSALRSLLAPLKREGKRIGFVPTMGFLHDGHLELVRRAKADCDVVVVSIFVNAEQFGPTEDFAQYPRDLERDSRLLREVGADVLFAPPQEEMYPAPTQTYVEVPALAARLIGKLRPIFFRGVATVVTKLFNMVQPDRAYFGEKDYQQLLVIKQMVADLAMPVEIMSVPTVREPDGLAMSSRNAYLNPQERQAATILYRSLMEARQWLASEALSPHELEQRLRAKIEAEPLAKIDMIAICNAETMEPAQNSLPQRTFIFVYVQFGPAKLLDHTIVEAHERKGATA
ncbi:pantoate--beta-alanine ligase [Pseudovibrio sp. SPO723]|uniref:pantoate--beta-alanine ligase n=1 Tax=Nesiotobacter zosterae TaxID=392721 RepID=UPI0029C51B21|nr:pantoate--beta-alanine ligase [Pseudovibrio sp. SPO723]MDX5595711.1 pantoate--beta-alanine ligase [Pseudovibrio sp. SPO723]